jgi:citrate synthase
MNKYHDTTGDVSYWNSRRGVIYTQKGGWEIGKGVAIHKHSVIDELMPAGSFFQVMVLNVTGRLPERKFIHWLESTFIGLSWPDPRIWCNKIGAMGALTKASPVVSICSGTMASDSRMYGPGTALNATAFICQAMSYCSEGGSVEDFIEKKAKLRGRLRVPGYARPFATGDERVVAMQALADSLGFEKGPHLQLAYQIQDYLMENYGEAINLAGYIVAFMSDQGYNADEIYRIYSMSVNSGIHAAYSETCDSPPDSFLPLRCDDIEYTGVPERSVPLQSTGTAIKTDP